MESGTVKEYTQECRSLNVAGRALFQAVIDRHQFSRIVQASSLPDLRCDFVLFKS